MKKALPILFLIGITLFLFIGRKNTPEGQINSWGIKLDIDSFKLTSFIRDDGESLQKEELEAQKEDIIIKIARFKAQNPEKLIDDKIYLLSSLYEPTTSPYPEVLTNIIECPEEFKPKEEKLGDGRFFTLFAGERLGFGVCSADLVKYKAIYGIFDCGEKGVFEVSLFSKERRNLEKIINSFSC